MIGHHVRIGGFKTLYLHIKLWTCNRFLQFTIKHGAVHHSIVDETFRCYAPNIIAWIYIKLYGKRNFCFAQWTQSNAVFDLRKQSMGASNRVRAGLRILPETAILVCGFVNHCLHSSTWYTRQTEYRSQFFYPTVNVSHFRIVLNSMAVPRPQSH